MHGWWICRSNVPAGPITSLTLLSAERGLRFVLYDFWKGTRLKSPLMQDLLPDLANELAHLLSRQGETELASQIPSLRVIDRCRCGDDFCATIYTVPKPNGPWGSKHHSIPLRPTAGFLILDIVGGKIACVEVLYRDEIRQKVQLLLP